MMSGKAASVAPSAVSKLLAELKLDYVRFELTDFHGISRSKVVPAAVAGEQVYMYAGLLGMSTTSEPIMLDEMLSEGCCRNEKVTPHWNTLLRLPCGGSKYVTGRVLCELDWNGEPLDSYPRTLCSNLIKRLLTEYGMKILGTFEYEFSIGVVREGAVCPYFETRPTFSTSEFSRIQEMLYDLEQELRAVGIQVQTMNIEYGQGQVEITTLPVEGIKIADHAFSFKGLVKEFFQRRGLLATFLCKPFEDGKGACNGGHFNHSLWSDNENKLSDGKTQDSLSELCKSWIGGILANSEGLQALVAPTASCYNRVKPWSWAPTNASWGIENRTVSVRAKTSSRGAYLEWRAPSATANPYFVLAATLAAGLQGLRDRLDPGPGFTGSAYEEDNIIKLPACLKDSLDALEKSSLVNLISLPPQLLRWYVKVKRKEVEDLYGTEKEKVPPVSKCQIAYLDLL